MLSNAVYLIVLAIVCCVISITDISYRKIHNSILAMLFIFQCLLSPLDIHMTTFLLVLTLGLISYVFMWFGAGDIKYAAILSLTIPLTDLPWAYVLTGFSGGLIAVIYWMKSKVISDECHIKNGIPYGVAISVGFYLVIFVQIAPHI